MKLRFLFFLLIPIFVFSQKEKKSNVDFIFHSITDNDSYHSLKLKYGISKRKILKWNPSLKKCKFLSDCPEIKKIKIYITEKNEFVRNLITDTILIDDNYDQELLYNNNFFEIDTSDFKLNDSVVVDTTKKLSLDSLVNQQGLLKKDTIINIAVLLPFLSDSRDSVVYNTPKKKLNYSSFLNKSKISMNFYSGLLFSIDEFVKDSLIIANVRVFDTYNNIDSIKNIIGEYKIDTMDLIIGPIYQKNFDYLINNLGESNAIIVSPLQSSHIETLYPENVYFFESDFNKKTLITSKYIFDNYVEENANTSISVFLNKSDNKKNVTKYLKEWRDNINFYEIEKSTISEEMSDEEIAKINDIVFIPSKDRVFVSDIISRLHALKDTSLIVFCSEVILDLKLIPHSELHSLNVHFFSEKKPFFPQKNFIKSFYKNFSINPQSKYVHQGYRCGKFFLNLFFKNKSDYLTDLFGVYYNFILQKNNIYRNEDFRLWKYEEYDISEITIPNESR